jgi:hypothetical protein
MGGLGLAAVTEAAITDDIFALTGNRRTKIVWSRQVGAVNGSYGSGTFRLMRFDTDVGTEADVFGTTGGYFRAKLTWDGERIVYNRSSEIHMVGFDGTGDQLVVSNAGLGCLWFDESSGKEYAFAAIGSGGYNTGDNTSAPLYRVNLADPSDRTLVFAGSHSNIWLSVSRDGTRLGGHFPWSSGGGIYNIATQTLDNFGQYG